MRVAVTGAGENGVFRAPAIEAALAQIFSADALEGIATPATASTATSTPAPSIAPISSA